MPSVEIYFIICLRECRKVAAVSYNPNRYVMMCSIGLCTFILLCSCRVQHLRKGDDMGKGISFDCGSTSVWGFRKLDDKN